ncbi:MAG: FemAB family protein [Candidatus Roizmanbacteria bacterium GW2011_GWC2_35_12]|nr:MAG: FemAB family protein [Candidatus Roizmanbacteria bacterium GW2011_GWC2_35_12]
MGIEVIRVRDKNNSYQMTLHPLPLGYKVGYVPRSRLPSHEVVNFFYEWGKKNRVLFIKFEPNIAVISIPSEQSEPRERNPVPTKLGCNASLDFSVDTLLRNDTGWVKSSHPLFPEWTQVLDLNKTEDELLKSFHSKTRYNIRLAEKKGVTVKELSNDKGFEDFAKLYFETCKRQKYLGHNYKYHKTVWDSLKKDVSHILIAYYKDAPLAAYELFYFKDVLYYVYGGTSSQNRNLMASNLLMWKAIKLGKKLGAKKFDMWGSLPHGYDQSHSWSGFTRFKEGYGTKFVKMVGSYDLIINPILYKIYNLAYKIREVILKI